MSRPVIHGIDGSPFVYAARLVLEEKGVDYDFAAIPFGMGVLKTPEHLARNPFGRIPVFEHDGFMLYETQAILRHMDRAFDGPPLQPTNLRALALMDQLLNIVDWYFFRNISAVIGFNRIIKPRFLNQPPDEEAIKAVMPQAEVCVKEIDRLMGANAYLTGDKVSLADLHLAPHFGYLMMTPEGVELTKPLPRLLGWWTRMTARDSMNRARPKAA